MSSMQMIASMKQGAGDERGQVIRSAAHPRPVHIHQSEARADLRRDGAVRASGGPLLAAKGAGARA